MSMLLDEKRLMALWVGCDLVEVYVLYCAFMNVYLMHFGGF